MTASPPVPRPRIGPRIGTLVGAAAAAIAAAALVDPRLAPVVAPAALLAADAVRGLLARRAAAREAAALRRTLPDAVELLAGALAGGASLPVALGAAGRHAPAPAGALLVRAAVALRAGDDPGAAVATGGPAARPLAALLGASARLGTPLADDLRLLAADLREAARVEARTAAAAAGVRGALAVGLLVAPGCLVLVVGAQVASLLARGP